MVNINKHPKSSSPLARCLNMGQRAPTSLLGGVAMVENPKSLAYRMEVETYQSRLKPRKLILLENMEVKNHE